MHINDLKKQVYFLAQLHYGDTELKTVQQLKAKFPHLNFRYKASWERAAKLLKRCLDNSELINSYAKYRSMNLVAHDYNALQHSSYISRNSAGAWRRIGTIQYDEVQDVWQYWTKYRLAFQHTSLKEVLEVIDF